MKSDYEERKAKRIARYQELADKNAQKSEQQSEQASKMACIIPFGQPILIGHHSESRDRNYRKRIGKLFEKSVESHAKSDYYKHRAEVAMSDDSVSSDDPKAIERLKERLSILEAYQELMKTANKIINNKKHNNETKISMLTELGFEQSEIDELVTLGWRGKGGFQRFQLSNNNLNISRVRKRIDQLEKRAKLVTHEITLNDVRIVMNVEANRVQLFFPGKPSEEVRQNLKRHGFRWSPRESAWQRHISNVAVQYAKEIAQRISKQD